MLKKLKKCVGILVNSQSILAVEVTKKGDSPEVTNYSKVMLEENIIESNCIVADPNKFKEAVKELLAKGINGEIKAKEVIIALPEENTFSHQITIPKEKRFDIDYIKEIAKDFIPIELNEAFFDYKMIRGEDLGKTVTLKFTAIQNIIVESLIEALKELEIEVIKVDIDIDCLIKSFDNPFNHNEGDFLLINMDSERDLISLKPKKGNDYRIISKKNNEGNEEIKKLERAIGQILSIANASEEIDIKKIYLTGPLSRVPEVRGMIERLFPGIIIKNSIEFVEIPEEIENDILKGIGICINEINGEGLKDFNLLPEKKKEELRVAPLIPKLNKYLVLAIVILVIPLIKVGIDATSNYIDYLTKSRESIILNEQSLNPYLTNIAKSKKEQKQMELVLLTLLEESMPVSPIVKSIDTYNKGGVALINVTYKNDADKKTYEIKLTAEVDSREETEAFIEQLEKSNIYKEVISPLSNLVGKEKRLVKIDLIVDKAKVKELFDNQEDK